MSEVLEIVRGYINDMGEGELYSTPSKDILEKYKGVFMLRKDKYDIVNYLWKEYGFRKYKKGLFWLVNPDDYNSLARKYSNVTENAIVFARTSIGNLFLLEKLNIGEAITYLNIHTGKTEIISTSFEVLFEFDIVIDSFWKEECYGKIELKSVKKQVQLEEDECLTFVPALALGGEEKVSNMKKVKIKENLEFLSKLHKE